MTVNSIRLLNALKFSDLDHPVDRRPQGARHPDLGFPKPVSLRNEKALLQPSLMCTNSAISDMIHEVS